MKKKDNTLQPIQIKEVSVSIEEFREIFFFLFWFQDATNHKRMCKSLDFLIGINYLLCLYADAYVRTMCFGCGFFFATINN